VFSMEVRVPTEDFGDERELSMFLNPALPRDPNFFGVFGGLFRTVVELRSIVRIEGADLVVDAAFFCGFSNWLGVGFREAAPTDGDVVFGGNPGEFPWGSERGRISGIFWVGFGGDTKVLKEDRHFRAEDSGVVSQDIDTIDENAPFRRPFQKCQETDQCGLS
jgi:hypothetical protein